MSLLVPDTGLLFWMLLSFGTVFFILKKYGFPVIIKMVEERKAYIDRSIKAAQEANEKLDGIKAESEAILAKAREEQAAMLKEALSEKERIISEAREQALAEAGQLIDNAREEIQAEKKRAIREVRNEIINLSVDIAGKVIRQKIADDASQKAVIDRMLDETPFYKS